MANGGQHTQHHGNEERKMNMHRFMLRNISITGLLKSILRLYFLMALLATAAAAQANVFNMPSGETSLQFVTVGDAGNLPDPVTGSLYGSVGYSYNMGEYDVTLGQYTAFLNAVAQTDTYGLYDTFMATEFSVAGISRSGSSGGYSYAVTGTAASKYNMPVFQVTWGDAARFCNWLDNGQGTATSVATAFALTETGAYTLNGGTSTTALMAVTRNAGATYVIPTENEWYKAAYYKSGGTNAGYWLYPTQSSTAPSNILSTTGTNNANWGQSNPATLLTPVGYYAGSPGPYRTFDQGGDVYQWNETAVATSARGLRGGSWNDNVSTGLHVNDRYTLGDPTFQLTTLGFRVESVPEPGSLTLLLAFAAGFGIWQLLARPSKCSSAKPISHRPFGGLKFPMSGNFMPALAWRGQPCAASHSGAADFREVPKPASCRAC
jgi:formylglycine-generating enzyme